jgi:hypothetical protein
MTPIDDAIASHTEMKPKMTGSARDDEKAKGDQTRSENVYMVTLTSAISVLYALTCHGMARYVHVELRRSLSPELD